MMRTYAFVHESAIDYGDWILGRKGALTPPRHVLKAAHVEDRFADIEKAAYKIFRCVIKLADLKPSETVLEVGCGIGRNASALAKYLDQKGTYEGFDIVPLSIGWCQQKNQSTISKLPFSPQRCLQQSLQPQRKTEPLRIQVPLQRRVLRFRFSDICVHAHDA